MGNYFKSDKHFGTSGVSCACVLITSFLIFIHGISILKVVKENSEIMCSNIKLYFLNLFKNGFIIIISVILVNN